MAAKRAVDQTIPSQKNGTGANFKMSKELPTAPSTINLRSQRGCDNRILPEMSGGLDPASAGPAKPGILLLSFNAIVGCILLSQSRKLLPHPKPSLTEFLSPTFASQAMSN